MKRYSTLFVAFLVMLTSQVFAQGPYAPAVDSAGTTAISKDSSCIASWVMECEIVRGYQNILNSAGPLASGGDHTSVYGKADGNVVSLGDGGMATITINPPLSDKPGYDFAVFENGFFDPVQKGYFLELAFVEVSSNGIDFFRFPGHSLTPTDVQIGTFGTIDPTEIDGFAGKYTAGFGTPFELQDMDTVVGLDIFNITHIRLVDVVGLLNSGYTSWDSDSNMINDPFPTEFASGGFDLDAVALLDFSLVNNVNELSEIPLQLYPNPTTGNIFWNPTNEQGWVTVTDISGKRKENVPYLQGQLDMSDWPQGFYFFTMTTEKGSVTRKILKM